MTHRASSSRVSPWQRLRRAPLALRLTAIGLLLLASVYGYLAIDQARRTPAADAPRIEFDVDGLDCPVWCAVRLTESIDGLDGAIVERLDQQNGKVVVRHDPGRQDRETLRQLLDARGFAVRAETELDGGRSAR